MAKFIKSIFTPETKKIRHDDEIDEGTEVPPLDIRRKLSMSRSGRLKQSYKKRQQLTVAVYGGEDLHTTEKPKSKEYHVNTPPPKSNSKFNSKINDIETQIDPSDFQTEYDGSKSPEEEIDNAFNIIDKS